MFTDIFRQIRYSSALRVTGRGYTVDRDYATHLFREMRPGQREVLLRVCLPVRSQQGIGAQIDARLVEADRISRLLGQRYLRAYQAEKQGRLADAIRLYEENVMDGDLSTLPYERLRQSFLKVGHLRDARRVCSAYLHTLAELVDRVPSIPQWVTAHRARFQSYLAEMK